MEISVDDSPLFSAQCSVKPAITFFLPLHVCANQSPSQKAVIRCSPHGPSTSRLYWTRSIAAKVSLMASRGLVTITYALRSQNRRHAVGILPFSFVNVTTWWGTSIHHLEKCFDSYSWVHFFSSKYRISTFSFHSSFLVRLYGFQVEHEAKDADGCAAGKVHSIFSSLQTAAARSFFQTALPGSQDGALSRFFGTKNQGWCVTFNWSVQIKLLTRLLTEPCLNRQSIADCENLTQVDMLMGDRIKI